MVYDVVCVGNSVVDAFLGIHEASEHVRLDGKTDEFCVRAGEKIPLDSCQFLLGGNASNVAVGLKRLGASVGLIVETGTDVLSEMILESLRKEQIPTENILKTPGPSGFAISLNFQKERTLFVEHIKRDHAFDFSSVQTQWIYLTSLGEEWEKAYEDTLSFVQNNNNCKLAFNPGTPQFSKGVESFLPILKQTTVLFVNKEEAEEISSYHPLAGGSNDAKSLLKNIKSMGPEVVVMTDGENGSMSIDEKGIIRSLPLFPCPVVERTGAGDGYASGFLAAFIKGKSVKEAMVWGALNASGVIGKIGAQPGLLTKSEIEHTQNSHMHFVTKEVY